MELLSILGQYLLLSFVVPGFCYFAAFYFCLHNERGVLRQYWLAVSIVGGLLISSVAFAIELLLRNFVWFDCYWFARIPFDRIHDSTSAGSFFAAESFMHLNIGLGLLIILIIFAFYNTDQARAKHEIGGWSIAAVIVIIAAANLLVSSYLFSRVNDVAYDMQDAVLQGSGKACECLPSHRDHGGLTLAECQKVIWPPPDKATWAPPG